MARRTARRTRPVARFTLNAVALMFFLVTLAPFIGRFSPTVDAFASFLPLAGGASIIVLLLSCWRHVRIAQVLSAVAIAAALWIMAPEWRARLVLLDQKINTGGETAITIVTHNLAVTNIDPERTIDALLASNADILLLQEARGNAEAALDRLRVRYPYASNCPKGCDLAIFSRLPADAVQWRMKDAEGRRFGPPLMWTRIHLADGRVFPVMTLHLPWPLPAKPQQIERREWIALMKDMDRSSLILAGDFNLTPWSAAMRELDDGFAPLRRITHGISSFPARFEEQPTLIPPLIAIDQMFVGSRWTVRSIERLPRTGSDHYPIKVILKLRN